MAVMVLTRQCVVTFLVCSCGLISISEIDVQKFCSAEHFWVVPVLWDSTALWTVLCHGCCTRDGGRAQWLLPSMP